MRVWRTRLAAEPVVYGGFAASVESVAFSPDGRQLATAHGDGTVRTWHCAACGPTQEILALAENLSRAPASNDSSRSLSRAEGRVEGDPTLGIGRPAKP